MAEGERQHKRPSCGWPVIETNAGGGTSAHPCGSEDNVFNVKGRGKYVGRARETPVCEKHLLDAWKSWNVDSAEPIHPPLLQGEDAGFLAAATRE